MRDEQFIAGDFHTTYLNEVLPGVNSNIVELEKYAAVAAAVAMLKPPPQVATLSELQPSKWGRLARSQLMEDHRDGG
jgi:hypothetical protein